MAKYVTRANKPLFIETPLWDDQRAALTPDLCVDGAKETDTGLIDLHGNAIYRVQDQIGFGRG